MPDNPFAQFKKPNPFAVYSTPGTGPKPSGNFAVPGSAPAVAPIAGSDKDPNYIRQVKGIEEGISSAFQRQGQANSAALERNNTVFRNNLPLGPKDKTDLATSLRQELDKRQGVQLYKQSLPSYAAALQSPDTTSGDQNLIIAFAKIMDPPSVVREGEAAGVADMGTASQQLQGVARKQLESKGKLTPELRAQMRNTLAVRMGEYNRAYSAERAFYKDISEKQGVSPDLVLGKHLGDSYAKIENQYFRGDPNKNAAAARAEAGRADNGGLPPGATPATGATHVEQMDPKNASLITELIRSGMPDDKINGILSDAKLGSIAPEALANARKTIAAGGSLNAAYTAPNSLWNKVASSPVGVGVSAAADAGGMGLTDEATGAIGWAQGKGNLPDLIKQANDKKQTSFAADPKASMIGSFAGMTTGMLTGGAAGNAARIPGLTRMFAGRGAQRALPLLGDVAAGAAYGAGSNNDNRLLGAGVGGAGGLAGNVVGGAVVRGAGRAVRGVRNAAVDYLDAAGVPMTGGQILGGTTKAIEDKLTSLPFVGDIIKNRRAEGYNAFNQAAFNEAGQPINAAVHGIGDAGLAHLDQVTSRAYGDALDGVNVNGNDPAFIGDMQNVVGRAQNLPEPMAGNADYTLRTRIGQGFDNGGNMTGNDFQQSVRGLRRDARSVAPLPYGHDFGQIAHGGENALEGLLTRQSPGTLPAYRSANAAYRHQSVLDDTINGAAKNQFDDAGNVVFTPAQLNSTSVRNGGLFGGQRPFQQLAQSAQQVLPSKIPDSGTAGRAAIGLLLATAGGGAIGGGGGATVGEGGAGGGMGAAAGLFAGLLNTRAGQRAMTTALLRRPQIAEQAGNWLVDRAPLGGHLGASFLSPLASNRVTPWLAR